MCESLAIEWTLEEVLDVSLVHKCIAREASCNTETSPESVGSPQSSVNCHMR